ncbi:hypothetical protein ACFQKF_05035 [Halalkalicoccus sp. GCM10025322]|uniref:hypothetical protein n=1 Tax=Halalkalicoccus TaxID=332246 RepID=UPI002F967153
MKRGERADLTVVCADCELRKDLSTPNEAVAFYRRHRSITGHDVDWKRADITDIEAVPKGDLKAVISALEERFPEGVPVGVVTAARSVQGATIGRTLEAIHERRMAGELYEPRDDHLRVT